MTNLYNQIVSSELLLILFFSLFLILLAASYKFDAYLKKKFSFFPNFGIFFCIILLLFTIIPLLNGTSKAKGASQPISSHMLAMQNSNLLRMPGMTGDTTKRYTVSFIKPVNPTSNVDEQLAFEVFDAATGEKVTLFNKIYEKNLHLIITDEKLQYFTHIHPELKDGIFVISTQFPHDGTFYLYLDFQPFGAIEQQFAFTLAVGNSNLREKINFLPDTQLTKVFGDLEATLSFPKPLQSEELSIGKQKLTYTLMDLKTRKPIRNLKPYLAAFGHLAMINTKTHEFLHVHPVNVIPVDSNSVGGPTVEFQPLGLYNKIKPGIYKLFAQFNPNNNLILTDFLVEVK